MKDTWGKYDPKPEKEIKERKSIIKPKLGEKKNAIIPVKDYREKYVGSIRTKSKYNNVKQKYNGNHYDSKLEAKYAQELDWRLHCGELKEIKRQVKVPLCLNEIFICNYYVDFRVVDKHGAIIYIEVKGKMTPDFIIKKKLFLAIINEIDPGATYEIWK